MELLSPRPCSGASQKVLFQQLEPLWAPRPHDRGALHQSFLELGVLPHSCLQGFGYSLERPLERVSSGPTSRAARADGPVASLDVCLGQGDWLVAGLRKPTFAVTLTNTLQVRFPVLILPHETLRIQRCRAHRASWRRKLPDQNTSPSSAA